MQNLVAAPPAVSKATPDRVPRSTAHLVAEVLAVSIALASLFLAIALALGPEKEHLVGPIGRMASGTLLWMLGSWVVYLVPASLLWFSTQLFLGRRTGWSGSRVVGIFLVVLATTGMLALPYADDPDAASHAFAQAGALGTFLVEWEGLRLVGGFGSLGAGMILATTMLAGIVMMTNLPISYLVMSAVALARRQPLPTFAAAGATLEAPPSAVEQRTFSDEVPRPPARPKKAAVVEVEEPEPEEVPSSSGFFGKLFGRRKEALLSEPDPAEGEEIALEPEPEMQQFDEDSLAAARALEEARIDEEFERALREEAELAKERALRAMAPTMGASAPKFDEELEIDPEADDDFQQEIRFEEATATLPVITGNPANEKLVGGDVMADGLAKLFPNKWEKGTDGEVKPPAGGKFAKSEESIRSAAEERAMRQAMARQAIVPEDEDFEVAGEDDPLFDDELETRPAGVAAAMKANEVSAVDKDAETLMFRARQMAAYRLPDIQMLDDPPIVDNRMSREEMLEISQTLEKTFADFNIVAKVVEVKQGPVVTRFELKPAPGVKVSRIVGLEHDIAMAMRAVSVRIVAPIPGKAAIGIEIPNRNRAGVYFKELVSCAEFWDHPSPLAIALGKTIEGLPNFADLKKMPHLLIAGATGAGKSVCLNTIICSLLYRQRPDRLRLLMVDPKRVELSIYQDIPHLISPVVCDAKRAAAALAWAVEQMEDRYKKLVEFSVRNIDGYNDIVTNPEKQAKHRGKKMDYMSHMVIIVDELADLMVVAKNEVEESIQRLAQMSRAVGIHLILATQRPSVNVITGIIKANFPTRIAFQVSQKVDSRTILDGNGAETLLGRGDMLFAPAGAGKPLRVQGAFLTDEEVERIANHCREMAPPMYDVEEFEPILSEKEQRELAKMMGSVGDMDDLDMQDAMVRGTNKTMGKVSAGMFVPHEGGSAGSADEEIDEALVRAAAKTILEARKGSTSLLQRRLKVGFARAGRLMDMLEQMGIVGPYKGSKPRDLLVDCDAALAQLEILENQIRHSGGDSRKAASVLDDLDGEDLAEFDEEDV